MTFVLSSLALISAFSVLITAVPELRDPTVAPPSAWFPNRRPISFQGGEKTTILTGYLSTATFYTEDRTNFRFRVKACSDATITFSDLTKGDASGVGTVTLTLGATSNTETTVKGGDASTKVFTTPYVLHCHEFRSFWIDWRTELLEVGRGPVVGRNVILSSDAFTDTRYTYYLELAPGLISGTAVWEVLENSADELISMNTDPGYNSIWKDVSDRNFIYVHITACFDARILLTSKPFDLEGKAYEIILNDRNDYQSKVRTQTKVLTSSSEKVLACEESRDFWISWYSHGTSAYIKVGKGIKYGKNVFMTAVDSEYPIDVRHLAVDSGEAMMSYGFEEDMEDSTMVTTQLSSPDVSLEERYKRVWLQSVQTEFMTFSVTSCDQVGIHLSTDGEVDTEFGVELLIGAANNTKTILRPLEGIGNIAEVLSPDVLHCDLTRYFWMSWKNGVIRLGKGRIYGMAEILSGQAPSHPYLSLSVTSFNSPAEWSFKARSSEDLKLIQTANQIAPLDTWRTVRTRQSISFQVKACSDVDILLSPYPGVDDTSYHFRVRMNLLKSNKTTIELIIGDAETGIELASKEIRNLLSCDSFREMYVAWWGGHIHVGRGRNQGILLSSFISAEHLNTEYIKAISLKADAGVDAQWAIKGDIGDVFIYDTGPKADYEHFVTFLPGANYVTFDVKTGSDAQVMLLQGIEGMDLTWLYVVISGQGNTMSSIKTRDGSFVANVTHDVGLLDAANFRTFWITWDDTTGLIQVGGGNVFLADGPFLTWQNPKPFPITAMSFKTGVPNADSFAGTWYIRQHMGLKTLFPTHRAIVAINQELTWRSVEHTTSLFFSVKGTSSQVSLTLAEHPGILKTDALKLVIGAKNNTKTTIQSEDSGDVYLEIDTPNILDKDSIKDFWVSWNEGEVQFGKSNIPGFDRLLNFQVIPVLNIRAVRFSTDYGKDGQWMVQMWDEAK